MTEAKKPRVMMADDEAHCRALMKAILSSMKCEVVAEARTGEETLKFYRELHPHLLLLDISMPVRTGDEVLEEILKEFPKAFVIMLTSVTDMGSIERCISLGAANYIRKDTPIEEIKLIIRETWQTFVKSAAKEGAQ
jgi:two-component system, chemotaxis family, chemotaxis protein CheY